MSKTKSQWDFGELFPAEQARKVFSVSELTWEIKRLLEKQVGQVWVSGEVTNLRAQSSGHIYFTLKDTNAQVSCVLFRNEAIAHRELLQDGQKVLLQGGVTVYEARGQYQLVVRAIELQGVGALQIAFEKLKQKLAAEGLFAPERKRPLPKYPRRIGLVTSPTGAAIRDVLHAVRRRNPSLEIIFVACRVQGEGAAREIAAAIQTLNEFAIRNSQFAIDLILLTRGGGSLEDLWAFNEEIVARAIFESVLPVVSAIGHEIDFTISDFVADVRAATPSAAAEIITEGVFSSCEFIFGAGRRIGRLCGAQLENKEDELVQVSQRLARVHPRRHINSLFQRLDDLQNGLMRYARQGVRHQRIAWRNFSEQLARVRPALLLKQRREVLQQKRQRLRDEASRRLRERRNHLATLDARLRLLGPEQVLSRGYSITMDAATGAVLHRAKGIKTGQLLKTHLKSGEILSRAEATPRKLTKDLPTGSRHQPPPPSSISAS